MDSQSEMFVVTKTRIHRSENIDAMERMVAVFTSPEDWCHSDVTRVKRIAAVIENYLAT